MATIRALRKLANLTQKELAEKIGVSKQHVSSWERGQFNPSPSSVRMLCRALSCKKDISEQKQSSAYQLMRQSDEAKERGIDLVSEMVKALEDEITNLTQSIKDISSNLSDLRN